MKNLLTLAIILAVTLIAAAAMAATTVTDTLTVSAAVSTTCRITTVTNIDFGTYDPTDSADNTAGSGSGEFRCTKGTSYQTYITGTRTMTDGTDDLDFELYSDSGRISVYPSANPGISGSAASNAKITSDIYGKIGALQDVEAGSYTKDLTFTVEY